MLLDNLIDDYLFNYVSSYKLNSGCCTMIKEMNEILDDYDVKKISIKDVIKKCVCNRHGHQYCIANIAVDNAVNTLLNSKVLLAHIQQRKPFINENGKFVKGFSDFEELYDFINSVIGDIKGIGILTTYDTAKRIGHLLSPAIYPKQYVYLTAGALEGAKKILGVDNLKFREPIQRFEPYFGSLGSLYIEDILCIYKSNFVLGGAIF